MEWRKRNLRTIHCWVSYLIRRAEKTNLAVVVFDIKRPNDRPDGVETGKDGDGRRRRWRKTTPPEGLK